jgi:hypothetical protein
VFDLTYEIAEIAVALLAAGGLLLVCWLLFGRIIAPVGEDGARMHRCARRGTAGDEQPSAV